MKNQNKAIFFVGSGISYDSKAPSVECITNFVTSDCNNWIETKEKYALEWKNLYQEMIQQAVHIIENAVQKAVWEEDRASKLRRATYEEIFHFFDLIKDYSSQIGFVGPTFAKLFESRADTRKSIVEFNKLTIKSSGSPVNTSNLYQQILNYISSVVWFALKEKNVPVGMDIFKNLVYEGYQLDIFSLNHDILIEELTRNNNLSLNRGFSNGVYERANWGKHDLNITLYKLHGSLDWVFKKGEKKILSCDLESISNPKLRFTGHFVEHFPIILSGEGKFSSLYGGIFADMHYEFRQKLYDGTTNRIIVGGYGWNDQPYNQLLLHWLDSSEKNKIIIYHESGLNGLINGSRYLDKGQIENLQEKKQIEIEPCWLGCASVENVNSKIED